MLRRLNLPSRELRNVIPTARNRFALPVLVEGLLSHFHQKATNRFGRVLPGGWPAWLCAAIGCVPGSRRTLCASTSCARGGNGRCCAVRDFGAGVCSRVAGRAEREPRSRVEEGVAEAESARSPWWERRRLPARTRARLRRPEVDLGRRAGVRPLCARHHVLRLRVRPGVGAIGLLLRHVRGSCSGVVEPKTRRHKQVVEWSSSGFPTCYGTF